MKTCYVHLAVDKAGIVKGVKVSAYYLNAPFKYFDYFWLKFGHSDFELHSFVLALPDRKTKPFSHLVDMKHQSDLNTRHVLHEISETLKK